MTKIIFWCYASGFIKTLIKQRMNMIKHNISLNSLTQLEVELLLEKLLRIMSDHSMATFIKINSGTIRLLPNARHKETNAKVPLMIEAAESILTPTNNRNS